jgi:hypothetical protein
VAKEKAIIVDVDGTLADMRGVRSPFEWDKVLQDKPHLDVIDLVKDLASLKKYKIIITTGRDGICEQDTVTWLRKYKVMIFISEKKVTSGKITLLNLRFIWIISDLTMMLSMLLMTEIKLLICGGH